MFSWIEFAILALRLIMKLVNWMHDRGMIDEGRRQVIAEVALGIAQKTATKEAIQEKVNAMSSDEVDAGLRDLEPK
jgi:hypothetical protein